MSPRKKLMELTDKNNVALLRRGNKAILESLRIAKKLGYTKLLLQDQGGWITYPQYGEQLKFEIIKLTTDYGIITENGLAQHLDDSCVLLVNSVTGYFAEQPLGKIHAMCKQKNALLINDATASIGTPLSLIGDLIIGSFGDAKPVNLEYGGFLASNEQVCEDDFEPSFKLPLLEKLNQLPERYRMFEKHHKIIKKDLEELQILHKDKRGINVIILTPDGYSTQRIKAYCKEKNYEYTECPRYIRVLAQAISIEVKRLT